MGGLGSGHRWRYGAKATTDAYRRLDVRALSRVGALTPGYAGGWQWVQCGTTVASIQIFANANSLCVNYRHRSGDENWSTENYPIRLVRTPCNFGGSRVWFQCPAQVCGRRVSILYGEGIFACRRCYDLAYASSRESPPDRAARRADKLRTKLGWGPGILNDLGDKPKWMRRGTFERLVEEYEIQADFCITLMKQQILAFSMGG